MPSACAVPAEYRAFPVITNGDAARMGNIAHQCGLLSSGPTSPSCPNHGRWTGNHGRWSRACRHEPGPRGGERSGPFRRRRAAPPGAGSTRVPAARRTRRGSAPRARGRRWNLRCDPLAIQHCVHLSWCPLSRGGNALWRASVRPRTAERRWRVSPGTGHARTIDDLRPRDIPGQCERLLSAGLAAPAQTGE